MVFVSTWLPRIQDRIQFLAVWQRRDPSQLGAGERAGAGGETHGAGERPAFGERHAEGAGEGIARAGRVHHVHFLAWQMFYLAILGDDERAVTAPRDDELPHAALLQPVREFERVGRVVGREAAQDAKLAL